MKTLLLFISCLVAVSVEAAQVRLVYEKAESSADTELVSELRQTVAVNSAIALMNDKFILSHPIDVVFGSGQQAYADIDAAKIFIPYSFVYDTRELFNAQGPGAVAATTGALVHTLFHEFAHILVAMHEIPVLGREEDAADTFASLMLIHYFPQGTESVIDAAQLYYLEREQPHTLKKWDFMGEHSLSVQRHYQLICHVYASDPEKYTDLRKRVGFSTDRAELCFDEFQVATKSWFDLLEPYLK